MPKEKDIFLWVLKNFVNTLKPRRFTGELKGTDHFGNKYYEIPAGGSRSKNARYFEPIGKEAEFDKELPAEWESWLRGRRKQPPTEEEVLRNYNLSLERKIKAEEIETKFKGPKELRPPESSHSNRGFPQYEEYEKIPGEKLEDSSSKKL